MIELDESVLTDLYEELKFKCAQNRERNEKIKHLTKIIKEQFMRQFEDKPIHPARPENEWKEFAKHKNIDL